MARINVNFVSYTFSRTMEITVIVPTMTIPETMGPGVKTHKKADKFPVLYLLHGVGNDHTAWTSYTNVELFAEENQIAIVNISAENKSYINYGSAENSMEGGDRFYDFIEGELQEFVCSMFPISERPEDTYIAGLSMGGYGTLVHALGNPEKYRAFGTFSASISDELMVNNPNIPQPEYQPGLLLKKLAAEGKKIPDCYIACGSDDFLINQNEILHTKLEEAGANVVWDRVDGYTHEWRFWNLEIEKFMAYLQTVRTDAYANQKRPA